MQETLDHNTHASVGAPPPGYRSIRQRELARAGTRRLIIVSGVLGIGLVSAGAALEFASHRSHTIPVIEADSRPIRVRPDNPGGMQIAGVGESILSGATSRTPETLAPPPEAPDPSGLRQQEQAARARDAAPKLPDSIQGLNKPGAIALDVPQPPSTDADAAAAAPSGPAPVIRPPSRSPPPPPHPPQSHPNPRPQRHEPRRRLPNRRYLPRPKLRPHRRCTRLRPEKNRCSWPPLARKPQPRRNGRACPV